MDKREIVKICANMLPPELAKGILEEDLPEPTINGPEKWPSDYADEQVIVWFDDIVEQFGDLKLTNSKWHEYNGYEMEFLGFDENDESLRIRVENDKHESLIIDVHV